jgi:2-polyprenyl-3-methyl-5-hydroxy-6-metoxy-1,4-benzoquinol methylase
MPASDDVTGDGSPVPVYLALPVEPAFTPVLEDIRAGATVLDLGCGTGRLANELARRGHEVYGVDESAAMLAHVRDDVTRVQARIQELDLGRWFDAVVLASQLINVADAQVRHDFLTAVVRHLLPDGVAYIQHFDPTSDRFQVGVVRSGEVATSDGPLHLTTHVHDRTGIRMRATVTMELAGNRWEQNFAADVLDDTQLVGALDTAGLRLGRRLDPVWFAAVLP